MKVKLGKFKSWIGPYQVVDWFKPIFGEERIDKFTDGAFFEKWSEKVSPFFQWIESKRHRNIKIQIDKYDTWNMDHTLALIILPMLIQLKATKHGAPSVDDKDVPKDLRKKAAPAVEKYETDDLWFKRWDWVMDEMIWAFTQLNDENNDDQFHTGEHDILWNPIDENDNTVAKEDAKYFEMLSGPNDTHVFDKKGHAKHHKRIQNGLCLFGKYYSGLWD